MAIEQTDKGNGGDGKPVAALALVQRESRVSTYEPRDIGEGITLASQLARSCLLGRNLDTPEKVFAVIVAGRELGLSAMTALRSIHLVEGKPVMAADTIIGLVRASGLCAYFRLVESSDQIATYEAQRKDTGDSARMSFSWADAERAGLGGKDNWRKYRGVMLRHRAAAMLARELFPDVVLNVYEQNEEDELRGAPRAVVIDAPAPTNAPAPARVPAATVVQPTPRAPAPAPAREAAQPQEAHHGQPVDAHSGAVERPATDWIVYIPKTGKMKMSDASAEQLGAFVHWQEDSRDRGQWKAEYADKNARQLALAIEWRAYKQAQAAPADEPPQEEAPPVGAQAEMDVQF